MKLIKYKILLLFTLGLIFLACGGGSEDTPSPPSIEPVVPVARPNAATLVFPENNTECNTGVIINEQRSNVTFTWNASENTDSYEINLKNLNNNNTTKQSTTINEATVEIDRGTPYEWFIISKSTGTTESATSTIWKFFNEGPGITNYAPFPAESVFPVRGSNLSITTNTISLEWTSSDIDDDIVSFEVYLDTMVNPTTLIGTTTGENILTSISVSNNTTYRWKIITFDAAGNSSTSEIFEFKIN